MAQTHPAAVSKEKGTPLEIVERETPSPGPDDILIEVKAVALNAIDVFQRDYGMPPVPVYPAVLGADTTGVVVKVGSNVPSSSSAPAVGSRVIALASSFWQNGSPDHGAFQKYALAQREAVIPLPDDLSFEKGAVFPLAVLTALTAWTTMGVPLSTRYTPQDKQAVLIWGGASSVGSFAIQTAKVLGFTVFATASPKHHDYLKSLGADHLFDYKDAEVVSKIVSAVKKTDGLKLYHAHAVVDGVLQSVLDVLKETKGDNHAQVANSPALAEGHPTLESTTIKFNLPSFDKAVRDKHIEEAFQGVVAPLLKEGKLVPSPHLQVESGGLEGLNAALDKQRAGVSATKIVVPL
ncbi:chaperonin 10-like protein [Cladorrhinum sp. PSN259]|nr:chaperonin 10-like protein [Cladorrhinum sp. PSN259]